MEFMKFENLPQDGQRITQAEYEVKKLIAIRPFDPKNKKTWPPEGVYFLGLDDCGEVDCCLRCDDHIFLQGIFNPSAMTDEEKERFCIADVIKHWSYSAPALQRHING